MNNILAIVGKLIYTILIYKTRNNPDATMKIIKMDRQDPNTHNIGFDCMEWHRAKITKKQEENIMDNLSKKELEMLLN